MAPLFDAILLGDGEEALVEMCECVRTSKLDGVSRQEILHRLSQIQGVYVPSLYQIVKDDTATRWGYAVPKEGSDAPSIVYKRCLPDLSVTDPVAQRIVPRLCKTGWRLRFSAAVLVAIGSVRLV